MKRFNRMLLTIVIFIGTWPLPAFPFSAADHKCCSCCLQFACQCGCTPTCGSEELLRNFKEPSGKNVGSLNKCVSCVVPEARKTLSISASTLEKKEVLLLKRALGGEKDYLLKRDATVPIVYILWLDFIPLFLLNNTFLL